MSTSSATSRFLRPIGIDSYEVWINSFMAATISRAENDRDGLFAAVVMLPNETVIGYDSNPVRLAARIAAGEFDSDTKDVRFEVIQWDEPEVGCTHAVLIYALPSQQELDRFSTDGPRGAVAAFREVRTIAMEERWAVYAARGW